MGGKKRQLFRKKLSPKSQALKSQITNKLQISNGTKWQTRKINTI